MAGSVSPVTSSVMATCRWNAAQDAVRSDGIELATVVDNSHAPGLNGRQMRDLQPRVGGHDTVGGGLVRRRRP